VRRDWAPVRVLYRTGERYVLPFLQRKGVTPAGLTFTGLGLSALAGLSYLLSPVLAGCLALIGGLCDALDGLMARSLGTAGPQGAFLDSVLDRYGESFLLIGIWAYLSRFPAYAPWGALSVWAALVGSFMVSYTRARGEGLDVSFQGGVFTREGRLVLIVAGSLFDPLAPGLVLLLAVAALAVGANLTAIHRFIIISGRLARPPAKIKPPEL